MSILVYRNAILNLELAEVVVRIKIMSLVQDNFSLIKIRAYDYKKFLDFWQVKFSKLE